MIHIKVEKLEAGKRIDTYITSKSEYSRAMIQKMMDNGNILVNGKKVKVSYKVQADDEITIKEQAAKEISLEAQDIPIEVLYEDNDIIVVNKPKGMVVHPANGNPDGH